MMFSVQHYLGFPDRLYNITFHTCGYDGLADLTSVIVEWRIAYNGEDKHSLNSLHPLCYHIFN